MRPAATELYRVFGLRKVLRLGPDLEPLDAPPYEASAPMFTRDGSLVVSATREGELRAHWVASGTQLWSAHVGRTGHSFAQHKELLLVGTGTELVALEAYSGKERWRLDLGGMVGGTIAIDGAVAFVPVRPSGLVAVELTEPRVRWRFKRARPEGITVLGQAAPLVDRSRETVYTGLPDGSLVAIATSNGEPRWTATLGTGRRAFRDVDAAPIFGPDGNLIAANYDSGLFGVDPDDGRVRWKNESLTQITGLTISSGRIVASDGGAVGLRPGGQVAWRYRAHKGFLGAPIPLGFGLVGLPSSSGRMPVLDAVTGKPTQIIDAGPAGSLVPPARLRKDLAVLTNRGTLLLLRYGEGSQISR